MKRAAILLSATILLAGCSTWSGSSTPGNPGGTPYAGEAGGVYDAGAGPNRPVKPDVYERPSSELLLPAPSAAPAAPLPPPPAQ